jgi:tetratricopeptide (TPR) repeat protein
VISIVIPYMHTEWRLKLLLASLETMPSKDVEICIVEVGESQHLFDQGDIHHEAKIKYRFVYSDRPFNRAWVMNVGVKHLSQGDTLILSDADLIFTPQWSATIYETKSPAVAWDQLYVLDKAATEEYLQSGALANPRVMWRPTLTGACGGVNIVPRDVYFEVGGMVESFEGWGGEDNATWARLVAFGHPFRCMKGAVWHLWHPQTSRNGQRRWDAYRMLNWSKEDWVRYMEGGWGDLAGAHIDFGAIDLHGRPDPSIPQHDGAVAGNAFDVATYRKLGTLYARQGAWNEASVEFKKALAVEPNSAKIHFMLGLSYTRMGMLDEAIHEYERALTINPKLALAHNNIAVVLYQEGNYGEAVKHCDEALELGYEVHPGFLEALLPHRQQMERNL